MDGIRLSAEPASAIREEAAGMIASVFQKPDAEHYWRWKHEENPFGESRVVIARRNGRVIGIRPLMPVNLLYRGESVRAVQCVDSAVDALERGKGIFRRMCMAALSGLNDTLVFNTPNEKSYPAYMKMGWHDVGGLVRFWGFLSVKALFGYLLKKYLPGFVKHPADATLHLLGHPDISGTFPEYATARLLEVEAKQRNDQIRLYGTIDAFQWRTRHPDGFRFLCYNYRNRLVLIFYLFSPGGFPCVRLLDALCDHSDPSAVAQGVREFIRIIGKEADYISLVCNERHPFLIYFRRIWPVRRNPVHFTVNASRLDRQDRKVFTYPRNWALMLSAFDYN